MTDPKNPEPPKPIIRTGKRGRPKGHAKTGGRKAGVPNKHSNISVQEKLRALNCDPVHGLVRLAENPKMDATVRARCYSELMKYLHPALSSVDSKVTGQTETLLTVVTGVARLPCDPIDVTPTPPLPDNFGSSSMPESVTGSDTPVALPAGCPWEPSSPSVDAPRRTRPSSDPMADENIDRHRADDSKIAELNRRAAGFVA